MTARVQILHNGVLMSEHMLKMDGVCNFGPGGDIVDLESGRRLLGYSLKGIWVEEWGTKEKKAAVESAKEWLTDATRRPNTPLNTPKDKSLKSLKIALLEIVDFIDDYL